MADFGSRLQWHVGLSRAALHRLISCFASVEHGGSENTSFDANEIKIGAIFFVVLILFLRGTNHVLSLRNRKLYLFRYPFTEALLF